MATLQPPPRRVPRTARRRRARTAAARACANCGTPAPLAYCPACGQEQHDYHRTLRALGDELLDNLAGWDGKIPATLWLLVRHPGRLTAEFLAGHRVRYLRPLRLYLSLSVVFFLALKTVPRERGGIVHIGGEFDGVPVTAVGDAPGVAAARPAARRAPTVDLSPGAHRREGGGPDWFERWYRGRKRALAAMTPEQRDRAVQASLVGNLLPNMVFVLLPVFALFLRLLYRRAPLFYAEHLVFALHVHAFFMLAMTAATLAPTKWAPAVVTSWMLAHLFVAMRRVYGGSRRRTLLKFAGLFATYGVVLLVAIAVASVLALALAA